MALQARVAIPATLLNLNLNLNLHCPLLTAHRLISLAAGGQGPNFDAGHGPIAYAYII